MRIISYKKANTFSLLILRIKGKLTLIIVSNSNGIVISKSNDITISKLDPF